MDEPPGTPQDSSGPSMRWAIAGSPTAPMRSEQAVMPSWVAASETETSVMPRSVHRADRLPSAALGSI